MSNSTGSPPVSQSQSQGGNSSSCIVIYPKPEAEYEEVVQNPQLFWNKLQLFSASLGINSLVPVVAGKPLDLQRLFVEVTSRGGIQKVIRDRKWGEVTRTFKFPSSVTSASFVLRKYYLSMLYHFEQVYYFRKEEPSVSLADPARTASDSAAVHFDDNAATNESSVTINLEVGNSLIGTIDGKFDYGYLITVNLGSEKLNGVLYHTPDSANTSAATAQRNWKRHQVALRDPSRPKPNRSGYTFFFAEQYARQKPLYQGQERAISKRIGLLWSRLTEAEKQVYQEKGVRDRERYRSEMTEYQSSSHAQVQ